MQNNQRIEFVNPKNDIAFKKIFGSEDKTEVLIGFLNAVLDLQGQDAIKSIRIRNPYQAVKLTIDKQSILDIYAIDNRDFSFIIEMQVANVSSILKRFAFYVAREYASQIDSGEGYPELAPVVFIGILDFEIFTKKVEKDGKNKEGDVQEEVPQPTPPKRKHDYLSCHEILDRETHEHHIKDFTFYFIELPKFTKKADQLTHILDKWVYFIKNAEDLDIIPHHAQELELQTAYQLAERMKWSREDLALYERRGIKMQDERGALTLAKAEGKAEAMTSVAQNLLSLGLPVEQIVQTTGLSAEQIHELSV